MKSYLLLRNNQESGPYTLQELKKLNLQPADLIWIEGMSTSWCYPTEISELKRTVKQSKAQAINLPAGNTTATTRKSKSTEAALQPTATATNKVSTSTTSLNNGYPYYEDAAKELFTEVKTYPKRRRSLTIGSNIMGLGLLLVGIIMTSFIVKNIVDTFGDTQVASAQATEIETVTYSSNHAALGPVVRNNQTTELHQDNTLPSTGVETPVVTPSAVIATKKVEPVSTVESNKEEVQLSKVTEVIKPEAFIENIPSPVVTEVKENKEVKEEVKITKRVKDVKSSMKISANDFKVGLLGGISNLELQVTNSSGSTVEKATIEVSYLKPNGTVINTEVLQLKNIPAGKSKGLKVPSSSRGVNVKYRIVEATSSESVDLVSS